MAASRPSTRLAAAWISGAARWMKRPTIVSEP